MPNPFSEGKNPFDFKQHGHRATAEFMFAFGLWFILRPILAAFILAIIAYKLGMINKH